MTSTELSSPDTRLYSPLALRRAWLSVDQNPQAINFAKTFAGKLLLHFAFIGVLAASFQLSSSSLLLIAVSLLLVAIAPAQRLLIITVSSLFYLAVRPFRVDGWTELVALKAQVLPISISPFALQITGVGLFLTFSTGFLYWQKRRRGSIIARRPVLSLMTMWFALIICAWSLPSQSIASAILWTVVGVSISSFWYLAYAAVDQKGKDTTPTWGRAGLMRGFWGGSATPLGKSFGYLNKFDAKSEEELAATRLKGLKLAVWGLLLCGLLRILERILFGTFNIPELQPAVAAHAQGAAFSAVMNWSSLLSNYFIDLVIIAIWGHLIVASIRMLGFRIPRNTRNPLASRTLAEFWNRYFFYFKELLVDFFFYPSFTRYFKKNPKLRIAFATFCAAALGNFLYHFTRDTFFFASLPLAEAIALFYTAAFYSMVLATGLIISQLRGARLKPEDGFLRYDLLPRLNVLAFFCFLKIFDDVSTQVTLSDRFNFTFSLFGI